MSGAGTSVNFVAIFIDRLSACIPWFCVGTIEPPKPLCFNMSLNSTVNIQPYVTSTSYSKFHPVLLAVILENQIQVTLRSRSDTVYTVQQAGLRTILKWYKRDG